MGRARLADQYERRAGRQRCRRRRGRHLPSGLQLDCERPEQRDERLDHLGNEVNLKLPAILALFSLTPGASGVAAQWSVSAELGVARFGGTSRDSAGATVGPYRPTTFDLRLERGAGRARVAVGVLHANTGLVAEGQGVAVVQYGIGSLWEIAPEVSLGVTRFGAGLEARVAAGPAPHGVVTRERRLERFGVRSGRHTERRRAARHPTLGRRSRSPVSTVTQASSGPGPPRAAGLDFKATPFSSRTPNRPCLLRARNSAASVRVAQTPAGRSE